MASEDLEESHMVLLSPFWNLAFSGPHPLYSNEQREHSQNVP